MEELLRTFEQWLIGERNLSASTVLRYVKTGRRFLSEQAMHDDILQVATLTGSDVNADILLRECARVSLARRRAGWRSCVRCCGSSTFASCSRCDWALRFRRSVAGGWRPSRS